MDNARTDSPGYTALRKIRRHIVWIIMAATIVAMMDRGNLSFAALGMSRDIGITPHVLGVGTSLFFVAYLVAEIPSNLIMWRVGARRWIARIMVSWGVVSGLMAAVQTPAHFYILRFLLGLAEAGFLPGMFLYLSYWVPEAHRGRFNGYLLFAIPIAGALTALISGEILQLDGLWGLEGWRLIFLLEAIPAVVLGVVILFVLPERPSAVTWLCDREKMWLAGELAHEAPPATHSGSTLARLIGMFARREIQILCLGYMGLNIVLSVLLWVPQVMQWGGVAESRIPHYAGSASLVAAVAMILWTRSSDIRLERRGHLALACIAGALGFALASSAAGPVPVTIGLTLASVGGFTAMAIFWTAPPTLLATEDRPAGIAAISLVGILAGMVTPIVVGNLREATGSYTGPMLIAGVGCLICAWGFRKALGGHVILENDRLDRPMTR